MHRLKRFRPSPAMIVAIVALVLSLGGTSYAAIVLPAGSVGTKQLKSNAVVGAKVKTGSLTIGDISPGSLSKTSRVAYTSSEYSVPVNAQTTESAATVSLTVPKAGFVLVQGWVNAYSETYPGEFRVTVRDDATSAESRYNAMYVAANQQMSTGNAAVFPVTAGKRSFSVRVYWDAAGVLGAFGSVSAQFIPYDGAGRATPPALPAASPAQVTPQQ